tara:strand:+ start:462 stop:635 length:174 start_codon:yes stop_codon:yes gene_type:complete
MCANCDKQSVMYLIATAIGQKAFCSERCYCEYVALPYLGEGYYGLPKWEQKDVEMFE